jgi:hypothetical protein
LAKLKLTRFQVLRTAILARHNYSRITSTKSPSRFMTTFSASLTNPTALLPQLHDLSCYVSKWILAPPPLSLQKHTDLRAHEFAHSADLWRQPRLSNVTCGWSWTLCGINPSISEGMSFVYQAWHEGGHIYIYIYIYRSIMYILYSVNRSVIVNQVYEKVMICIHTSICTADNDSGLRHRIVGHSR